jgi:uncharacterized BrkB/YihY/UPF0761 family membrane protein
MKTEHLLGVLIALGFVFVIGSWYIENWLFLEIGFWYLIIMPITIVSIYFFIPLYGWIKRKIKNRNK